jgi:hypothetical protein
MPELMEKPILVSLAELRALGRFVRWQDLDAQLTHEREKLAGIRGYPLFSTRLEPDDEIDLFIEPHWKRVKFVRFTDGRLTWRDGKEESSVDYNRYHVAPASHFTEWKGDLSGAKTAQLLETFQVVHQDHHIKESNVEKVDGTYITIETQSFPTGNHWSGYMTYGHYTFHIADPRLKVDGVAAREPLFNYSIAVSHRWLDKKEPDPDGKQFAQLMKFCEQQNLHPCQTFLIDYCSLPQRPRTRAESLFFRKQLPEFQKQFARHVVVLNEGSEDCATRGWCMLELMLSALNDSVINPAEMNPKLVEAFKLAQSYMKHEKMNQQSMLSHFGHGAGGLTMQNWARFSRIPENVGIYNLKFEQRAKIVDLFEKELKVTEKRDIPIIVKLLKSLAFRES